MSDPRVSELLGAADRALRELGARWYLFGAQAVSIWGRPRSTADVDITAAWPPEKAEVLVEKMSAAGFASRVSEPLEFALRTRVVPLLHRPTGLPLDVVLAGPGLEEQFFDRAQKVSMGNLLLPVISPEDLLVSKILAGRPRDVDDVRGILAEQAGSLDLERVRELLGLLEQALDRRDLLQVLEDQLRRR